VTTPKTIPLVKFRNGTPATFFRRTVCYADDVVKLEAKLEKSIVSDEDLHRLTMCIYDDLEHGKMVRAVERIKETFSLETKNQT